MTGQAAKQNADFLLNRSQAISLVCVAALIKEGVITFAGEYSELATIALAEAGEELALQIGGMPQ